MDSVRDELENLTRIIRVIAKQFGPHCEVVLHDLTANYDQTIVAIENSHVTGRSIGDCGSNLGLEVLRGTETAHSRYGYVNRMPNGKVLKSSTTYLTDPQGQVIGAVCINLDITEMMKAQEMLEGYELLPPTQVLHPEEQEVFATNVSELLDHLLEQCEAKIGRAPEYMSKEEKIEAVRFLDQKGAFLITKSGDRVCEYLNISKYTLYSHLDTVRKHVNRMGK